MIYILLALASGLAWWLMSLVIPMPLAFIVMAFLLLLIAVTSNAIDPEEESSIKGNLKGESKVDGRDRTNGKKCDRTK
jgi:hypothetical protein